MVGSPCNDGAGSFGYAIAPTTNNPSNQQNGQLSTICLFNDGPLRGSIFDYNPRPPLGIGTTCNDGNGSKGTIISASDEPIKNRTEQMSTFCRFETGQLAGQIVNYSPRPPLRVGSECTDGISSNGHIIPAPESEIQTQSQSVQMSTRCRFETGPASGTVIDYSPRPPIPVGSVCNNRLGSVGHIIP